MKEISISDRILLLLTGILAAYQIVVGIEGFNSLAVVSYTIGFGVLLIAVLLMIIMGFEVLDSPLVVIVSTILPLSISLGLVAEYYPQFSSIYMIFAIVGLFAVAITRYAAPKIIANFVLMIVHGISGVLIFILPFILSINEATSPGFILVGIGGGLIGLGGLLLSFLKTGHPILSREKILAILPALLFVMTLAYVAGFALAKT